MEREFCPELAVKKKSQQVVTPPRGGKRRRGGFPNREDGVGAHVESAAEVFFVFSNGDLWQRGLETGHHMLTAKKIGIAQMRKAVRGEKVETPRVVLTSPLIVPMTRLAEDLAWIVWI